LPQRIESWQPADDDAFGAAQRVGKYPGIWITGGMVGFGGKSTSTYFVGYVNSHTNHLCARQMPLGESFSYPLAIFQINTQHTQFFPHFFFLPAAKQV